MKSLDKLNMQLLSISDNDFKNGDEVLSIKTKDFSILITRKRKYQLMLSDRFPELSPEITYSIAEFIIDLMNKENNYEHRKTNRSKKS